MQRRKRTATLRVESETGTEQREKEKEGKGQWSWSSTLSSDLLNSSNYNDRRRATVSRAAGNKTGRKTGTEKG